MTRTAQQPDTSEAGKIRHNISKDYTYSSDGVRVNKHEYHKLQIRNAKKITGQTDDYKQLKKDMDKEVNKESQDFYNSRQKRQALQKKALDKLAEQIKKETPARLKPKGKQVFDSSPRDEISQRLREGGH